MAVSSESRALNRLESWSNWVLLELHRLRAAVARLLEPRDRGRHTGSRAYLVGLFHDGGPMIGLTDRLVKYTLPTGSEKGRIRTISASRIRNVPGKKKKAAERIDNDAPSSRGELDRLHLGGMRHDVDENL